MCTSANHNILIDGTYKLSLYAVAQFFQSQSKKSAWRRGGESRHRLRSPRSLEISGVMGLKIWFIPLLVLVMNYTCADTKSLVAVDIMVMPVEHEVPSEVSEAITRNGQFCTLCEDFTSQAMYYLGENDTQTQFISSLHLACSRLHSFEKQCIMLVEYYAPLFFVEIATVRPEQICEKVNLCEEMTLVRLSKRNDACKLCHHIVVEILLKLKDPDTELEVIEILLKGCNKVEFFVQECKRLVLQYGPLILANTRNFLETTDVCAAIHACKASNQAAANPQLFVAAS